MIIANFIGILIFLYMLWRVLKDDYHFEKIFNLGFIILSVFLLNSFILKYLLSEYWFWINLFSLVLASLFIIKRQKMKFFEILNAMVIGLLPWLSMIYINDAINNSSLSSFVIFWVVLICVFLYFFSSANYRRFSWYKSGRIGFSGIVAALIFFLFRFVSAFLNSSIISYVGVLEVYFSGSTTLLLIIMLYNLSTHKE